MSSYELTQCAQPFLNSSFVRSFLLLFDDRDFVAMIPISNWQSCFQDALIYPYTSCTIIHDGSAPPLEDLEVYAQNCYKIYNGKRHARPIQILEIVDAQATAATTA